MTIFDITGDGATTKIFTSHGGFHTIQVYGTFAGTITPQMDLTGDDANFDGVLSDDGSADKTITKRGSTNLQPLKNGTRIRFLIAGFSTAYKILITE